LLLHLQSFPTRRSSDLTSAFQAALDAAASAGGGTVYASHGTYLFSGSLRVPVGVTLKGMWESVPSHTGLRDAGYPKPGDYGTTLDRKSTRLNSSHVKIS